jgi:hypothetical protein
VHRDPPSQTGDPSPRPQGRYENEREKVMNKQPRSFHQNGMELGYPSVNPGTLQSSKMKLDQERRVTVLGKGWSHASVT